MDSNTKWKTLGVKEKLAISTAVIAFACGWILVGFAAFIPLFISEQGVLFVLGEGLLYASGVFGVSAYFSSETKRLRNDLRMMMRNEQRQLEEEIEQKFEENGSE